MHLGRMHCTGRCLGKVLTSELKVMMDVYFIASTALPETLADLAFPLSFEYYDIVTY